MTDLDPAVRYCAQGHRNTATAAFCSACGERLAFAPPAAGEPAPRPPGESAPQSPVEPTPIGLPAWGAPVPEVPREPLPAPAARGRSRMPFIIGAGLLVVAIVAGAAYVTLGGRPTLRGVAVLYDADGGISGDWDDCEGTGGYSDFGAGMRLSIRGRNDEIVGSGEVRNLDAELLPRLVEMDWESDSDDLIGLDEREDADAAQAELRDLLEGSEGLTCWVYFEAKLEDSDYYAIELSDRGALEYSKADLAEHHYTVNMTLGL